MKLQIWRVRARFHQPKTCRVGRSRPSLAHLLKPSPDFRTDPRAVDGFCLDSGLWVWGSGYGRDVEGYRGIGSRSDCVLGLCAEHVVLV